MVRADLTLHIITISVLYCLFFPCGAEVDTKKDPIFTETSDPLSPWNSFPTASPGGLSTQHPYLYYATLTFAIIISGTTLLLLIRACFRTCQMYNPRIIQPQNYVPVVTRYRLSIGAADNILINGQYFPPEKPPDYESVAINSHSSTEIKPPKDTHISYETPPPSYGSII